MASPSSSVSPEFDLQSVARALGGRVYGAQVRAPGPGHSPLDDSLSVTLDPSAPDGFLVHSFASDDPLRCKDYVRGRIGCSSSSPPSDSGSHRRIVAFHDYVDEQGELLSRPFGTSQRGSPSGAQTPTDRANGSGP